jgi:hypothetical protein
MLPKALAGDPAGMAGHWLSPCVLAGKASNLRLASECWACPHLDQLRFWLPPGAERL